MREPKAKAQEPDVELSTDVPAAPRDPVVQEAVRKLLASGMTVSEIAELTSASVRTVYRWMDGDGALPVFRRALLAAVQGL